MYRIGYPFWKFCAKHGVPMKLRVKVILDKEAGVFVATSDDLPGLVAEDETMDALVTEVFTVIDDLLTEYLHVTPPSRPTTDLRLCAA